MVQQPFKIKKIIVTEKEDTCSYCGNKGVYWAGSCVMLPDDDSGVWDGETWMSTVYCDKCDRGIEQYYQAKFIYKKEERYWKE